MRSDSSEQGLKMCVYDNGQLEQPTIGLAVTSEKHTSGYSSGSNASLQVIGSLEIATFTV